MKVYLPYYEGKPTHHLFVQPGRQYSSSNWLDKDGKPIMFTVEFKHGCADVPEGLGQYLVDHELAQETRIIIPERKVLC